MHVRDGLSLREIASAPACPAHPPAPARFLSRLGIPVHTLHADPDACKVRWSLDVDPVDLY